MTHAFRRQRLDVAEINIDQRLQMRDSLDESHVEDLVERLRAKQPLEGEPPVVFYDGTLFMLSDGFHRVEAARRAKLKKLEVRLAEGNFRDALLYACGANSTHGLPRSRVAKRKAVETLLVDPEWTQHPDTWIADRAGVNRNYVASIRKGLEEEGKIRPRPDFDGESKRGRGRPPEPRPAPTPVTEPVNEDADNLPEDEGLFAPASDADDVAPPVDDLPAEEEAEPEPPKPASRKQEKREYTYEHLETPIEVVRAMPEPIAKVIRDGRAVRAEVDLLRGIVRRLGRFTHSPIVRMLDVAGQMRAMSVSLDHVEHFSAFAICPDCQGSGDANQCPTCRGAGWIVKGAFDRLNAQKRMVCEAWKLPEEMVGDDK